MLLCASAENLGTDLQSPEVTSVLLPPLIARWNSVGDADEMGLIPLLECMMFVSTALGPLFSPLAPEIYARCGLVCKHVRATFSNMIEKL